MPGINTFYKIYAERPMRASVNEEKEVENKESLSEESVEQVKKNNDEPVQSVGDVIKDNVKESIKKKSCSEDELDEAVDHDKYINKSKKKWADSETSARDRQTYAKIGMKHTIAKKANEDVDEEAIDESAEDQVDTARKKHLQSQSSKNYSQVASDIASHTKDAKTKFVAKKMAQKHLSNAHQQEHARMDAQDRASKAYLGTKSTDADEKSIARNKKKTSSEEVIDESLDTGKAPNPNLTRKMAASDRAKKADTIRSMVKQKKLKKDGTPKKTGVMDGKVFNKETGEIYSNGKKNEEVNEQKVAELVAAVRDKNSDKCPDCNESPCKCKKTSKKEKNISEEDMSYIVGTVVNRILEEVKNVSEEENTEDVVSSTENIQNEEVATEESNTAENTESNEEKVESEVNNDSVNEEVDAAELKVRLEAVNATPFMMKALDEEKFDIVKSYLELKEM